MTKLFATWAAHMMSAVGDGEGKAVPLYTRKAYEDFSMVPLILNPLNTELNPICHLLALLGGATVVVISRLRVNLNTRWR
jgi:hypothetical protein